MAELLADWLESKRHEIDEKPFADYARTVRSHLAPALGTILIQKLTAHQIQRFLDAKRDSYPEGRGARTVEVCYRRLYQALKYATIHRWVERNEAALVKAPVAKPKRRTTWDDAQLARFLSVAEEQGRGPIFLLEVSTGVRRGELLGLRWSDINWEKRTMGITQTVGPDGHGRPRVKQRTKTDAGQRIVELDDACIAALQTQRASQEEQRQTAGARWQDSDLVFASRVGTPLNPNNLYRVYLRLIDVAGLPRISLHDLRHTHATLMIEQGEQIHVVSQRLGHKRVSTTMDIYVKVMPGQQRKAAEAFGARLARAREAHAENT